MVDNVYDIAAGAQHTCAIVDAENPNDPDMRHIKCWGFANDGQLGANPIIQLDYSSIGIPYTAYPYWDTRDTILNTLSYSQIPRTVQDGSVDTTIIVSPDNNNTKDYIGIQTGMPFEGKFKELVAGRTSACVLDGSNQLWCWGKMSYITNPAAACQDLTLSANPTECTIWPPPALWPNNNTTRVWPVAAIVDQNRSGSTDERNLNGGDGLPQGLLYHLAFAARPLRVTYSSDPLALPTGAQPNSVVKANTLSAHNDHVCMLVDEPNTTKTNVYCLGRNQFGEVGDGTNSPSGYAVPLRGDVNGNTVRAVQLEVGNSHSCAVVDDNNIKCWGSNAKSQIGNENLMRDESFRPFDVLLR